MSKVCLKIKESPYKTCVYGYTFYFSSNFNRIRFINNVDYYIDNETLKIISKYKVKINLVEFLAISYYKKIEKRGFYIEDLNKNEISDHHIFKLGR